MASQLLTFKFNASVLTIWSVPKRLHWVHSLARVWPAGFARLRTTILACVGYMQTCGCAGPITAAIAVAATACTSITFASLLINN
jgi:hypothetical protein